MAFSARKTREKIEIYEKQLITDKTSSRSACGRIFNSAMPFSAYEKCFGFFLFDVYSIYLSREMDSRGHGKGAID